jgi:hypothetical protein
MKPAAARICVHELLPLWRARRPCRFMWLTQRLCRVQIGLGQRFQGAGGAPCLATLQLMHASCVASRYASPRSVGAAGDA